MTTESWNDNTNPPAENPAPPAREPHAPWETAEPAMPQAPASAPVAAPQQPPMAPRPAAPGPEFGWGPTTPSGDEPLPVCDYTSDSEEPCEEQPVWHGRPSWSHTLGPPNGRVKGGRA